MRGCIKYKFSFIDWVLVGALIAAVILFIRGIFRNDEIRIVKTSGVTIIFAKFGVMAVAFDNVAQTVKGVELNHWAEKEREIDWWHLTTTWHSSFFENPIVHDFWHLGFRYADWSVAGGLWGVWLQIPDWFIVLVLGVRPGLKIYRRLRTGRQGMGFPVENGK